MHAYVIIAGLAADLARADCHQPERFLFHQRNTGAYSTSIPRLRH